MHRKVDGAMPADGSTSPDALEKRVRKQRSSEGKVEASATADVSAGSADV